MTFTLPNVWPVNCISTPLFYTWIIPFFSLWQIFHLCFPRSLLIIFTLSISFLPQLKRGTSFRLRDCMFALCIRPARGRAPCPPPATPPIMWFLWLCWQAGPLSTGSSVVLPCSASLMTESPLAPRHKILGPPFWLFFAMRKCKCLYFCNMLWSEVF